MARRTITSNADAVSRAMRASARQIPFATSRALNNLAYGARGQLVAQTPAELDRPTPFTVRGYQYTKSTKTHLVASVWIPENRERYMKKMVEGGVRTPFRRAIGIPTSAQRKNAYGNMTRGTIARLLSRSDTFSGTPAGWNTSAGIWQRMKTKLKPLVLWKRRATYPKTYLPFYDIVKRYVDRNWRGAFNDSLSRALASRFGN